MASARRIIVEFLGIDKSVAATANSLGGKLGAFSTAMSTVGAKMMSTGKTMSRSVTLPIVGAGVAAIKLASDFEASMSQIQGLVGASDKQMKLYNDRVLQMAVDLPQAPKELADALFFVTSAGFKGKKALDVLHQSAKASAAGLGETKTVADAVTSAINAYGEKNLSASQATDILTSTVREGKAEASSIAPVLGNLIPLTSELGVGFDEVGGAIAAMTRTGASAASSATSIQSILSGLLKPTKQGSEALDAMGLSYEGLRDSVDKKGLFPTLMNVREAFKGNKEALAQVIPNVRALRGFLSLTGDQAEKNAGIFDRLSESTGATDKAFKVASETASFQFKSALSSVQVALIEVGNVLMPFAVQAAQGMASLASGFSNLSPHMQNIILIAAGIAAAAGPVLMIFGGLAMAIGALITPVGLVIAAGVALAAGLGALYLKSAEFRSAVDDMVAQLKGLAPVFGQIASAAKQIWAKFGDDIIAHIVKAMKAVADVISGAVKIIAGILKVFTSVMKGDWKGAWDGVVQILKGAWQLLKGAVSLGINAIEGILKAGWAVVKGLTQTAWNAIKALLSAIWGDIKSTVNSGINAAEGVVKAGWNAVKSATSAAWNGIKSAISDAVQAVIAAMGRMVNGVREKVAAVVNLVGALPGRIKGFFTSAGSWLISAGASIISGLISGITSKLGELGSKLGSVGSFIKAHKGPPEKDKIMLTPAGQMIMDGLIKGIESRKTALAKVLEGMADGIKKMVDKIRDLMKQRSDFAKSFRSFGESVFSSSGEIDPETGQAGPVTVASMMQAAQANANQAENLFFAMRRLTKMGLSDDLIKQLQASGQGGIEQIMALSNATREEIAEFNRLNATANRELLQAGLLGAREIFDDEIKHEKRNLHLAQAIRDEMRKLREHEDKNTVVMLKLDGHVIHTSLLAIKRKSGKELGLG